MNLHLLVTAILSALIFGCRGERSRDEVGEGGQLPLDLTRGAAVYVEWVHRPSPGTSPAFGDIVLLDFASRKKHSLTSDEYLDSAPALSPDRRVVAFLSARIGAPEMLKAIGEASPKQLYLLELSSGATLWVDSLFVEETIREGRSIVCITWSADGKVLYFTRGTNAVYAILARGDSLWKVMESEDSAESITEIAASPDGRHIACSFFTLNPIRAGIFVFDLISGERKDLLDKMKSRELCGWSPDGDELLVHRIATPDSSFWIYRKLATDGPYMVDVRLDDSVTSVSEGMFDDKGNLVMVATRRSRSNKNSGSQPGVDIAVYDRKLKKLEWLTADGEEKSSLSVSYFRQNR